MLPLLLLFVRPKLQQNQEKSETKPAIWEHLGRILFNSHASKITSNKN